MIRKILAPTDLSELSRAGVVLDALNYIKDYIDGTLSFRWSSDGRLRELWHDG
jgi:hypothetical protein